PTNRSSLGSPRVRLRLRRPGELGPGRRGDEVSPCSRSGFRLSRRELPTRAGARLGRGAPRGVEWLRGARRAVPPGVGPACAPAGRGPRGDRGTPLPRRLRAVPWFAPPRHTRLRGV